MWEMATDRDCMCLKTRSKLSVTSSRKLKKYKIGRIGKHRRDTRVFFAGFYLSHLLHDKQKRPKDNINIIAN